MVKSEKHLYNPVKYVDPSTKGRCPFCHKMVQSLESHIHDKHKGEKLNIKKTHM